MALSVVLTVGLYLALIICPLTNVHGWTGGWSPAARFLTPIAPLLGLFVFAGLKAAPMPLAAAVVVAADRHQRLRVAAPQDPVERRRRTRGVLRTARFQRVRIPAVADQAVEPVSQVTQKGVLRVHRVIVFIVNPSRRRVQRASADYFLDARCDAWAPRTAM